MEISWKNRKKVKDFARRFTDNQPVLCPDHSPSGLPIDEPEIDLSNDARHPSKTFEKIVDDELVVKGENPEEVKEGVRDEVRQELRYVFQTVFYEKSDGIACVKCYRERVAAEHGVPIRMEVPEKYKRISEL